MPRAGRERGPVRGLGEGRRGGLALADEVVALCENGDEAGRFGYVHVLLQDDLSIAEKIEAIAKCLPCRRRGVRAGPQKEIAQLRPWASATCPCVHGQDPVLVLGRCHPSSVPPNEVPQKCPRIFITVRGG